jgi:hypothetical protein
MNVCPQLTATKKKEKNNESRAWNDSEYEWKLKGEGNTFNSEIVKSNGTEKSHCVSLFDFSFSFSLQYASASKN